MEEKVKRSGSALERFVPILLLVSIGLAFVFSKDKGVLKIDITNQKLTSVSKKDSELGDIKDIFSFHPFILILYNR